VNRWVETNIAAKFKAVGIPFCLALIKFENKARKPGPAFNVAMASAFADGADYLYRTNDDTTPETAFASKFAAKLAAFTVRAARGRLSALSVLHRRPGLHGVLLYGRAGCLTAKMTVFGPDSPQMSALSRRTPRRGTRKCERRQVGPEAGPTPAFSSCIPSNSHRNAWANLHLLGQPNTVLAADPDARLRAPDAPRDFPHVLPTGARRLVHG
jgi:hypothetical protein